MKRYFGMVIILASIFLAAGINAQETINWNIYYPAPFGTFDYFKLVPRATIPEPCSIGTFFVDNNGELFFCRDNDSGQGEWTSNTQGIWTQDENDLFLRETESNPNLSVGIGTEAPDYLFHVKDPNDPTYQMFFNSAKGAFRAGQDEMGWWDDSYVGNWSMGLGRNTLASSEHSIAIGYLAKALAVSSIALGTNVHADGARSVVIGANSSTGSLAEDSVVIGNTNSAEGARAVAIGIDVHAIGDDSVAFGNATQAKGAKSVTMGNNIVVEGASSIGIGLDDTQRTVTQANTMVIVGGKVGIGTTTPDGILEVGDDSGNYTVEINKSDSVNADMVVFNSNGSPFAKIQGMADESLKIGTVTSTKLQLGANDQVSMTIDGSGNVGMGLTDPQRLVNIKAEDTGVSSSHFIAGSELVIEGTDTGILLYGLQDTKLSSGITFPEINADGTFNDMWALYREADTVGGDGHFRIGYGSLSSPTLNKEVFFITKDGNVGLGKKMGGGWSSFPPTHPLEMAGGAYCTGASWEVASSRVYKENIHPLDLKESLNAFKELEAVKFQYKTVDDGFHVGFIAEDLPGLVSVADRKGLSPMNIVALLTKVVQYQRQEIKELETRINMK